VFAAQHTREFELFNNRVRFLDQFLDLGDLFLGLRFLGELEQNLRVFQRGNSLSERFERVGEACPLLRDLFRFFGIIPKVGGQSNLL
jgi:hypothetical protein